MEENKNKNERQNVDAAQGNAQGGNGGQGGRKRRRRHRNHGGNGGGNNPQAQNQNAQGKQTQNAQNGQNNGQNGHNQPKQAQNPPKQPKNNQAQNGQKQPQNNQNQNNQNEQGKHKHKNKQGQPQNQQNGQNQNNQQSKNNNGKNNEKKEENRKDTYVYTLDGNLYINLTNKCSNGCDFCVRNERSSYYGNYLWLRHGDPTPEKVIAAANGMGDLSRFKEVVFCGFGEPTYKVTEMVALCDYFHGKGLKTRLNTNGQGNLINKRDIVPELKDKIDFVSISLNASCVEKYQPICRSQFGEAGFAGVIEFAKLCRKNGLDCRFSIVDCIGEEEVEACKRLAESVKIPLYVRKYITDS
ncbi:MAG: radical SAM protein [Clostridia bacterium]|nr:radical SAM protein [Clostridia bacterium]MBQ8446517.1 radical SAM protein [Clostridia bacterium]